MKRIHSNRSICIVPAVLALFLTAAISYAAPTKAVEAIGGIEFIPIKGGTFVMGDILQKNKDASPPHRVTVSAFSMGKYEVTFDQFDAFCVATKRAKPSDEGWGRGNRPVINVSWKDAVAFTKWLSQKSGREIRLPSEAQWEFAARGGKTTRYWWGNTMETNMANCAKCGSQWDGKSTAPVGSFKPNPFGLFDMTGNVYEWCLDSKHKNYQDAPTNGRAWINKKDKQHINRGGAWFTPPEETSSFARSWDPADQRSNIIGLRLVMEP